MTMKRLAGLFALLMFWGTAMAYEEPDYDVLAERDGYELRRYAPYIVAEVDVDGTFKTAGNSAFGILAGYIFGDNADRQKMAMTVPVESLPASPRRGGDEEPVESLPAAQIRGVDEEPVESLPAVAPTGVEAAAVDSAANRFTYAFVMEKKYSLASLPTPEDERIRIREKPARVVAVRMYSGGWSEKKYRDQERQLLDDLAGDGILARGKPMFARYNGPFTPWFLRRNEIIVDVDWPQET